MRLLPVLLLLTIAYCCVYASSQEADDQHQQQQEEEAALAAYTKELEKYENDIKEVSELNGTEEIKYDEKRGLFSRWCGHCSSKAKSPIQLACLKLKWESYMKKKRCGFWRRRHTCYRKRWRLVRKPYCCSGSSLKVLKLGNKKFKFCFKNTVCGGFFGPKQIYKVCRFASLKFCRPWGYKKIGNYCYPR